MKVLKYQKVARDGIDGLAKYIYITKDWVLIASFSTVWTDPTAPNIHHLELRKSSSDSDTFQVVVFRVYTSKFTNKSNIYQKTSGRIFGIVKYSRKTDEADTILMEVLL